MICKKQASKQACILLKKMTPAERERALGIMQGILISKGNKILETLNNEPNNKKIA